MAGLRQTGTRVPNGEVPPPRRNTTRPGEVTDDVTDGREFSIPVEDARPSQLYVEAGKLAAVLEWMAVDDPDYERIPAVRLDGEWVLTDGHTRALVAVLAGEDELRVVEDTDDLPLAVYERCVEWCDEAGVATPADLVGRVVSEETYRTAWIDRCHRLVDQLDDESNDAPDAG